MTDSETWATAIMVEHRLLGGPATAAFDDARVMVERLTGNKLLWPGPAEMFSKEMPAYVGPSAEADLAPIDILYGCYTPRGSRIDIFVNRIRTDAPRFNAQFLDLLTVVRIHEYAHAVVHTGIVAEELGELAADGTMDWDSLRADRHTAFSRLDDESSELLAQAITWGCISEEPNSQRSRRLAETYLALEERQPKRYQLPLAVKQRARLADWPILLRTAQDNLDAYRERSFRLAEGLAELIRKTAEPKRAIETSRNDPLGAVACELQESLALLIARTECIELRMYKEQAHRRPHFHLEFKSEFEASYALDTFERLAGYMPRKYEEVILSVARANRHRLVEAWNSLNGTARISLSGGAA